MGLKRLYVVIAGLCEALYWFIEAQMGLYRLYIGS